jgi:hypothetical protein
LIKNVTIDCFKESLTWKEDTAHAIMKHFGISYDKVTMMTYSNSKGNGFFEKIGTRAETTLEQICAIP